MIAIDLSKEQVLDADQKVIQPLNFIRNQQVNTKMIFIVKEAEETILNSKGPVRVL